jgi:excisionase family DNA binding protein
MQKIHFIEVTPEELIEEVVSRLQNYENKLNVSEAYLPPQAVAELFSVSLSTVYNWRQRGIIKACQIGGKVYFRRSELDQSLTDLNPSSR